MAKRGRDIVLPVDDEAIGQARMLLRTARFGALATLNPETGEPFASRTATATDADGTPVILISTLAAHTSALTSDPRCSLLVGEPGKGDPLAHPRLSISCSAVRLDRNSDGTDHTRQRYLNRHPKALLYADFADFSFFRLDVRSASLNGGFAKAFALDRDHLLLATELSASIATAEQSAIEHMNEDHSDAIQLLAGGKEQEHGWKLTGIDAEGYDLAKGDIIRRKLFPNPLSGPQDIRTVFIELLKTIRDG